MDNNFIEVMEKRSDSELLEIVTKLRNDYQPEAIEAAELVIKNRNLSADQIEQAKQEIKEKEIAITEKENEPLNTGQKILFFMFFWGVIPWAMAGTFKTSGYLKQYKDAWRFMKYGLFTFLGLNGLIFLILYFIFN
jgi:beta-lactamase regulating signal transducer with metallopeptidase domain